MFLLTNVNDLINEASKIKVIKLTAELIVKF